MGTENESLGTEIDAMLKSYAGAIDGVRLFGDISEPSDEAQQDEFGVGSIGEFLALSGKLGFGAQKPILDIGLAALVYRSRFEGDNDSFNKKYRFAGAAITAFELIAKGMPSANEGKSVGQ